MKHYCNNIDIQVPEVFLSVWAWKYTAKFNCHEPERQKERQTERETDLKRRSKTDCPLSRCIFAISSRVQDRIWIVCLVLLTT